MPRRAVLSYTFPDGPRAPKGAMIAPPWDPIEIERLEVFEDDDGISIEFYVPGKDSSVSVSLYQTLDEARAFCLEELSIGPDDWTKH